MDLNQQIAEIDGKCACIETGWLSIRVCEFCHKIKRPNYLAPENLHELVRMAEKIGEIDIKIIRVGDNRKLRRVTLITKELTESVGVSYESLSIALAEAIVVAKG